MRRPLRVLVVEDSPLFADVICGILNRDPELSVIGVAADGRQAVEMTKRLRPDVITMDIQMGGMDGLEAIEHIMYVSPTPILVITGDPRVHSSEMHFEALRRGALDVMAKPELWRAPLEYTETLRRHIKLLSGVAVVRHIGVRWNQKKRQEKTDQPPLPKTPPREHQGVTAGHAAEQLPAPGSGRIVSVVASTGGPPALAQILGSLPAAFPAGILVVQHISTGFTPAMASWLDNVSPLKVQLARHGARLEPGTVLLAPEDQHMTVGSFGQISLDTSPPLGGHRPSGTLLLCSIARHYGSHGIGVVLSGMGNDGVEGLMAIRDAGGTTLAQDEESCVVFGMPRVAWETGAAQMVLSLERIPIVLCHLVGPSFSGTKGKMGLRDQ